MRLIVEGWRFLCHSYSVINQFQLLEMIKHPNLEVFHRDIPYKNPDWRTDINLLDTTIQSLYNIPLAPQDLEADVTFKIYCPWNFNKSITPQTWVFAVTEWGKVSRTILNAMKIEKITDSPVNSESMIITASQWSKKGFIRSGVAENRIKIVPHGFDPTLYYPLSDTQRKSLRKELGWDDYFIFLNIGGCNSRKGIRVLLKAFATIASRHPQARLCLKGSELLYLSQKEILEASKIVLNEAEQNLVMSRIIYIGEHLSYAKIAQLYQGADTYVSPYLAEGFNLTVLEAAACGLPIICTAGGPTDDFTHPDFALRISSKFRPTIIYSETMFMLHPSGKHLVSLMEMVMENHIWRDRARQIAPNYVLQRFTWKHIVDRLFQVFSSGTIKNQSPSNFEFF